MSEDKKMTIRGKYINDTSLKPESVSGANIVFSPHGKCVISFFDEVPYPPDEYEIEVEINGDMISNKTNENSKYDIARYFKFFAEMDIDTAKTIAEMIFEMIGDGEVVENDGD